MNWPVSHWVLSWLSGSLSTLSPCVFPLLPMVLAGVVQGLAQDGEINRGVRQGHALDVAETVGEVRQPVLLRVA
jgi:cytochrome c biogenesis protein CcdA